MASPLSRRSWSERSQRLQDAGQAALVLVVALTVVLLTIGGVMVTTISNNDPIIKQASIQRYAYRALSSGLNAYQSAINADPYLAVCNSNTNYPNGANKNAQCSGLSYQTWSQVPGTDTGSGVIPEYYMFDNPQEVLDPTTKALTYLEVQIVGAAGFSGKDVYYSTVAKFSPANGFLDNVWWTNFESSGDPSTCRYWWATNYSNSGSCTPVYFTGSDNITGPVFSNDSIFVDGGPSFGSGFGVTTADPSCLFVDPLDGTNGKAPSPAGSNTNCALAASRDVGSSNYSAALSSNGASNFEPIPQDNQSLANYAKQGGCYYTGPTTITLSSAGMIVSSPGTSADVSGNSNGTGQTNDFATDTSVCPVNNTTASALPINGVIYVAGAPAGSTTAHNPFDGVTVTSGCPRGSSSCLIDNQTNTNNTCAQSGGCYYGATGAPDTEGDAFVSGNLSGQLTIGALNDVVIDGPITYADCAGNWAGVASESNCSYLNASTATNDSLGLIAYNYVEVNRPVDANGNILPNCGTSGAQAAPLCDPSTASGNNLTIDASLLGLQQSFIVNNYDQTPVEGNLIVYGSIQQNSRGTIGTFDPRTGNATSGYSKQYFWDSRLQLYSPPYYLTPGTQSWALTSSALTYTGSEPPCPLPLATPIASSIPYPAYPASTATAAGTSTTSACPAAS
jgi:hypothetical protein